MHSRRVGVIVSGSLVGGLEMKLDEWYSVEDIRAWQICRDRRGKESVFLYGHRCAPGYHQSSGAG
jgi:hypothetical protein